MNVYPVETGNFKLDGGAMFGVVPKHIWHKNYPADVNNLCTWAMRSLLIEEGNRLILIDTGIGDKQSEKFFSYLHLHGEDSLDRSLHQLGFEVKDITDVILTHLHFDHVGGAVVRNKQGILVPKFTHARYWSNTSHWNWAIHPNPREKASFLSENLLPLQESGQLNFIPMGANFSEKIEFLWVNGHTEAQMIPIIHLGDKKMVFMADLLPSVGHLPLAYVPSFDIRPLQSMEEKQAFYTKAAKEEYLLFFQHDPKIECCTIQLSEKGAKVKQLTTLKEWM